MNKEKIISKICMRLPGGDLFQKLVQSHSLRYKNLVSITDIDLPVNFLKYAVLRYFKNTIRYTLSMQILNIVSLKYNDTLVPSFLNIDGMKIPISINENDKGSCASEFMDFMLQEVCEDKIVCNFLSDEGPYEYDKVKIDRENIVIDCGASIGMFSALASHKGAIVYSFEPNESIIETHLFKTARLNPNINICNYALSDRCGKLWFVVNNEKHISSHLEDPNSKEHKNSIMVQAITLDEFVQQNHLPRIDFIKADIEGAERYMLLGAQNVLREFAPKIAICTYHKPDDPRMLRKLIKQANPNYIIVEKWRKMYAYVPEELRNPKRT